MKQKGTVTRFSNIKDLNPLEKVLALQDLIKTDPEILNGNAGSLKSLNLDALVTKFFSKAPTEFLERRSFDELKQVLKDCTAALHTFYSENRKEYVKAFKVGANKQALVCILHDRPFIVNSVSECIRSFGFKIDILLHPVITLEELRVSIVYTELEGLSPEQIKNLIRVIENTLEDLLLATDDFTSMLIECEKVASDLEKAESGQLYTKNEKLEVAEFIRWLTDGGFVFLGYAAVAFDKRSNTLLEPSSQLGIFKTSNTYLPALLKEVRNDWEYTIESHLLTYVSKLHIESMIHRRVRINHIIVAYPHNTTGTTNIYSLVGMFTSRALAQESSSVPLIRRKVQKLIKLEDLAFNSHDYKYLIDAIDRMPKDLALRLDIDSLREMGRLIINLQNRHETKVSMRLDPSKRGATILIVMPRERFNSTVRARIQEFIEREFSVPAGSSEFHLDLGNKPLARFYFYVPTSDFDALKYNVGRLDDNINRISRTWEENLEEKISIAGFDNPSSVIARYGKAFPEDYQATLSVEDCIVDIKAIERLSESNPIIIQFNNTSYYDAEDSLTIYNAQQQISISKAFPILENAGLEVIAETTTEITPLASSPVYIQRFLIVPKDEHIISKQKAEEHLSPGLEKIFRQEAENDWLNALLISADLDISAIGVLRAYSSLFWQLSAYATKRTIGEAFSQTPPAAALFWRMFEVRFDPALNLSTEERQEEFKNLHNRYLDELDNVLDINRDRTLRGLITLLQYTLRTNYYQGQDFLALKLHSEKIEIMRQPRPKFEIFISSPFMEGVHLRAAHIARGGIRWSDRNDDFRSEILGLLKTQKVKNAVIVPNGAKGGFTVRNLPKQQEFVPAAVERAYREFIRGVLSVTDNLVDGETQTPPQVIAYDGPDTYLVVAADKGTAALSNTANKIATEEFNFWLGDAFASGGSQGYDHKKYGITARGAWETVKRRFHDLGINYTAEPFTVVGIGDMSGDVFGNGLIYSDKIKLLAAFNHKHIFVDPDPDPARSYKERCRLFQTPRSQWADYNREIISSGGAVYERYDKEILLTAEARRALGIPAETPEKVSGEQLISFILQAPVDLLWNGGVGTYIKATDETHAQVNDGTNDRVRVDAAQVRARVIAEGGNLGLTQRARIECATRGIGVNTDAIDNSAGVDLSDHEVNIKILCTQLVKSGLLSMEERNELLENVAGEVVEMVLTHNRRHAALLSLGKRRSFKSIEYYISLTRALHSMGYVNRHLEALPDEDDFSDRILKNHGLGSPELAIYLAGVKMWVKDILLESPLCRDPQLARYLFDYFPQAFRERFPEQIKSHPLSLNIIASQATNSLIDIVGITFVHRMCITHSTKPVTVIKCLLAGELILETQNILPDIEELNNSANNENYLMLLQNLGKVLRDASSWLISYHGEELNLDEMVKLYKEPYKDLASKGSHIFTGERQVQHAELLTQYMGLGIPEPVAKKLALGPNIIAALEMLWAARKSNSEIVFVARIFSQIYEILNLHVILGGKVSIETPTKWDHQLLLGAFEDIRRSVSLLTCKLIALDATEEATIRYKLQSSASYSELTTVLAELQKSKISVAAISIIAKHLRNFSLV